MGGRFFDGKNHLWENASEGDMAEVHWCGDGCVPMVKSSSLSE